jgi:hypothetical protein
LRLPRHAAGFSPVRRFKALAASISRAMRWRVRDAVTGFKVQIGESASNTCSVVISRTFRSCRLGASPIERAHLLLLFRRQTLAPAGVLLLSNSLNVLQLCVVAGFLMRGSTPSLQGDLAFPGLVARAARRQYIAGHAVADPGEFHLRPLAVEVGEAEGPHPDRCSRAQPD